MPNIIIITITADTKRNAIKKNTGAAIIRIRITKVPVRKLRIVKAKKVIIVVTLDRTIHYLIKCSLIIYVFSQTG